ATITCQDPSLTITKTADHATVNAGDAIGFTVVVSNGGPGVAKGVVLSDPLPAGATWSVDPAVTGCSIASGTLTCTVGDLASGAKFTVHVAAQTSYEACSVYDNTARASADNAPSVDASATITCQKPSLTITKTADAATVNAGDPIGFMVTVSNDGPGVAKAVTLHDPLPAGVTWTISPAVAGCSITAGALDCSFGDLAASTSKSVHVSAATSADACPTYDNTASASASNAPTVDDSASITCQAPDVTVVKTADTGTISAGDVAGFSMVVTNLGPGTASNVTLNDPLPANVGWSLDPAVAGCSISGGVLSCSWASLAAGPAHAITVHISGETTAAACGLVDNTVHVAATNEPTGKQGNNDSHASVTVVCPPVSITKTADAASVSAGDQIGFVITVSNNSDFTALNVTVDDPLPTNSGLGWSIDGPTNGFSIVSGHLVHGATPLAAHTSLTVHIVSPTANATCGSVDNTANLTFNGGTGTDSSTVQVNCPDLTIVKTADAATVNAGDPIGFMVTVSNGGPGVAKAVTLHDPLPAGVTWSVSPAVAGCSITSGTLDCTIGDIAAHGTFSVHVAATTSKAACSVYDNTATASASNAPDVSASATVTCQAPKLTITKTADAAAVEAGAPIGFTITVGNDGPGTAYGVKLHDPLPAGVTWSVDPAVEGCSIASGTLTCDIGTLPVEGSFSVHISAKTSLAACALYDNTATASATNADDVSAEAVINCVEPEV
ncbi:MAG TPA: hypothetical protein VIH37_09850, partial [Candidatus Limnocylindrales bacterium]